MSISKTERKQVTDLFNKIPSCKFKDTLDTFSPKKGSSFCDEPIFDLFNYAVKCIELLIPQVEQDVKNLILAIYVILNSNSRGSLINMVYGDPIGDYRNYVADKSRLLSEDNLVLLEVVLETDFRRIEVPRDLRPAKLKTDIQVAVYNMIRLITLLHAVKFDLCESSGVEGIIFNTVAEYLPNVRYEAYAGAVGLLTGSVSKKPKSSSETRYRNQFGAKEIVVIVNEGKMKYGRRFYPSITYRIVSTGEFVTCTKQSFEQSFKVFG